MINFKFRFEHFIILVLATLLLLENCRGNDQDCDDKTTTVKVSEEILTEKDSVTNNNIKNREPENVQVIETPEKVTIVADPEKLDPAEQILLKKVSRYQDTTRLKDAIIYSDILSEGRILKMDLKTSIDHLKTTIETTTNTTTQAGGLFVSPSADYVPGLGFTSAGAGINYIKGDLGFGIGSFWGFGTNQIGFRFTIHKKLF
ncbi:hypothetical protein ACNKXS_03425 [Christiangramia marina]|uniref:hypothetical protein n=1 Tax=Christiangramia marina TaxID=409436 RepID=UPI003AA90CE5